VSDLKGENQRVHHRAAAGHALPTARILDSGLHPPAKQNPYHWRGRRFLMDYRGDTACEKPEALKGFWNFAMVGSKI
jgi:hypothetical protein